VKRLRSRVTEDEAVQNTWSFLSRAGCVVNDLTRADYGYDMHVLLPSKVPGEQEASWEVGPQVVHIQVKGSSKGESAAVSARHLQMYLDATVPTYIAYWRGPLKRRGACQWIAAAEVLCAQGIPKSAKPARQIWDEDWFIADATYRAGVVSPTARRSWETRMAALASSTDGAGWTKGLAEIALLDQAQSGHYQSTDDWPAVRDVALELRSAAEEKGLLTDEALTALETAEQQDWINAIEASAYFHSDTELTDTAAADALAQKALAVSAGRLTDLLAITLQPHVAN
jgi:hypothetical protein